jgi:hypothetical protein
MFKALQPSHQNKYVEKYLINSDFKNGQQAEINTKKRKTSKNG